MNTVLTFIVLALFSTAFAEKSLDGYETLDMNQFNDISPKPSQARVKFQSSCTTKTGEIISSSDARFAHCMNQSMLDSKKQKIPQSPFNQQPKQSVEFSTDL
jgi:hypothetical protein